MSIPHDLSFECLTVLGPLVLTSDLFLLLGGEIVGDVKGLADLLRRLSLDHIGDSLATNIKEGLDIEVVGGKDDLEQHLLVDLHELLIPLIDVGGLLAGVGVIILGRSRVVLVMLAPFDNLLEDSVIDIGNGDLGRHLLISKIIKHVLDQDTLLGNLTVNFDLVAIIGDKSKLLDFGLRHVE